MASPSAPSVPSAPLAASSDAPLATSSAVPRPEYFKPKCTYCEVVGQCIDFSCNMDSYVKCGLCDDIICTGCMMVCNKNPSHIFCKPCFCRRDSFTKCSVCSQFFCKGKCGNKDKCSWCSKLSNF